MAILPRPMSAALPALVALSLLLPSGGRAQAATDTFGGGTGGVGSHGTSLYQAPSDTTGWGSNASKPETPPAPPPASEAQLPAAEFGAAPIGAGNFRGNAGGAVSAGVGSRSDLDGALPPLGQ